MGFWHPALSKSTNLQNYSTIYKSIIAKFAFKDFLRDTEKQHFKFIDPKRTMDINLYLLTLYKQAIYFRVLFDHLQTR